MSNEDLLAAVESTQSAYWEALSELELALGVELDSTVDYAQTTIEDIMADAEGAEE